MSKKREHHKLFMVGANAPFQYTEAYKSLRTNLEFFVGNRMTAKPFWLPPLFPMREKVMFQ